MGAGAVSSLSSNAAIPLSADEFDCEEALGELAHAIDPNVAEEEFARTHSQVGKARFIVNSFHTLADWDAKTHGNIGSLIAEKLVALMPDQARDAWLSEVGRHADASWVRRQHLPDLVHLLSAETLAEKIDHRIEAKLVPINGALALHETLTAELNKTRDAEKKTAFHTRQLIDALDNVHLVSDRQATSRCVQDHLASLTADEAIDALSHTSHGFLRVMHEVDPKALLAQWGEKATAGFFQNAQSIDAIGRLSAPLRKELSGKLSANYESMAKGDLYKLHLLMQALKTGAGPAPFLKATFDTALKASTPENRSRLALALTLDSLCDEEAQGPLGPAVDDLIQAAGPTFFFDAFANANPHQQRRLLASLDGAWLGEKVPAEVLATWVNGAPLEKTLGSIDSPFQKYLVGARLSAVVDPLVKGGVGIDWIAAWCDRMGRHLDATVLLEALQKSVANHPLSDRLMVARAWMRQVPDDHADRGEARGYRLEAAASGSGPLFASRYAHEQAALVKAVAAGLTNSRDALELTQALRKEARFEHPTAEMADLIESRVKNQGHLYEAMEALRARIAEDSP